MVTERYKRVYVFNGAEADYGFVVSNDRYKGNYNLPAFVPRKMSIKEAQAILSSGEIEFGDYIPEVIKKYIMDSMLSLLVGEESDWNIISFEVKPGELVLRIVNPKICAIQDAIDSLDLENPRDFIQVDFIEGYSDVSSYLYFTLHPIENEGKSKSISIQLSNSREDIDEVDYFDVWIGSSAAEVEEHHKINRSLRKTRLTFSEELDPNGQQIMLGEIEETR